MYRKLCYAEYSDCVELEVHYCCSCDCPFVRLDCSRQELRFCSKECEERKRVKRSQLEKEIEKHLRFNHPLENVIYNSKEIINYELDIYFPDRKLAIEFNGVMHYKPVYGESTLLRTKEKDRLKKQQCVDNNITLVVIDNSEMKKCMHTDVEPIRQYIDHILYTQSYFNTEITYQEIVLGEYKELTWKDIPLMIYLNLLSLK